MTDPLLELLLALDGVPQDPRYHPEGDALFHSLQVYRCAAAETADPELRAAALLHDVGKAESGAEHDTLGAELLQGLVPERVCWLVAHHLDLLRAPRQTRALLAGDPRLAALERLRRWDLAGRDPRASVCAPEVALAGLDRRALDRRCIEELRSGRP
jgi:putative nucleotidyltransferase with HDIG domain